jgi:4-hydroxy-tetrahydrodipicolinate synthase
MVPPRSLAGIAVALATPFSDSLDPANAERIDFTAWQTLVDGLISAGVDGLFVNASTGEFYALEPEERQVALRFCLQAANGRVPICCNVGAITTRETVKLAHQAEAAGADALAVVTPYFIQPSPDEMAAHYMEVCRAVRLPVLAYNCPQHGGSQLSAQTVALVASQCENFAGIDDASGRLEQAIAYRDAVPAERAFAVFVGHERLVLPALSHGCAGAVSGCANIAPRLFVNLYRAFLEGRLDEAARLQTLASDLAAAVSLQTFPSALKEAMRMAGWRSGACRKPAGPVAEEARQAVAAMLARLDAEGLLPIKRKSATA